MSLTAFLPTTKETIFHSRANVGVARRFGLVTNLMKGLDERNVSSGPVFESRLGVPHGLGCVPNGVGVKERYGEPERGE
jgi:hypothetical protein